MCTSIAMARGDFFFGRNMDWDCGFGERVAITPRRFPFDFRNSGLTGAELFQEDLEGEKLVTYPLEEKASVNWLNRRQA